MVIEQSDFMAKSRLTGVSQLLGTGWMYASVCAWLTLWAIYHNAHLCC